MNVQAARSFIYQNARPLDFARWQYLFENGSADAVLQCLSVYQNPDGGFGHGLEADCLNPDSSPVQTWAATEILREIGFTQSNHPMVQGILRYLEETDAFDGHIWANTVPTNDDYPHAPWWNHVPTATVNYNPTASLIGFILRFGTPGTAIHTKAQRLLHEAYHWFKVNCPTESMHTAACFVELYEDLRKCPPMGVDLREFKALLQRQISHSLSANSTVWATEYVCKPSLFLSSRTSPFYAENAVLCAMECRFIEETQSSDGTWAVTWEWADYPEQWHIAKNYWKSDLILKNMKFYRNMTE